MAEDQSKINLWIRANQYTFDEQTYALMPPMYRQAYLEAVGAVSVWGSRLQTAQERYTEAQERLKGLFDVVTTMPPATQELEDPESNIIEFAKRLAKLPDNVVMLEDFRTPPDAA